MATLAPNSNLPMVRDVEANVAPNAASAGFGRTAGPVSQARQSGPLDVADPSGMDDIEVFVLGVPMTDPQVLRATQTVFALIWVDFFFLCDYMLFAIEQGQINLIVLLLFILLPCTGYFGILYNSSGLLRCFGCLTGCEGFFWTIAVMVIMNVMFTTSVTDDSIHQHAEYTLLFIFHAVSYNVLAYYGCFLATKVEQGAALPARRRNNREDYNILGLQVSDMRTLQDVQNLFNSSWLVFFFMLYFSVALFDHAVESVIKGTFYIFLVYCAFIGLWLCMVHGVFLGVKKNDAALLG